MSVRRLPFVAALLATAVILDLVAAAAVFVDRRDAPALPEFRQEDVSDLDWTVAPYSSVTAAEGFTVTPEPPATVDEAGHVFFRGHTLYPALNASYALAALVRFRATGDRIWVDRAQTAVNQVLATSQDGFLPHTFQDTDVYGAGMPRPWYSSASQGLMLSAMAGLYSVTEDPRLMAAAQPVFRSLTTVRGFFAGSAPAPDPWLDVVDGRRYLWFERFTRGTAPTQVLSEQSRALLGVYDYARVFASSGQDRRLARTLFAGGLATLRMALRKARVPGQIELFSLAARNRNLNGHDILERDIAALGHITGEPMWARYKTLLDRDDDLPIFARLPVEIADREVEPYVPAPDEPPFRLRPRTPARVTERGVVSYRDGKTDPALSASYALACLSQYDQDQDRAWLSRAEVAVSDVLRQSQDGLLPYRYQNTDIYGMRLPQPWFSAEGQGLMLSALVRLHEVTGERRWIRAAAPVFAALSNVRDFEKDGLPATRDWVSFVDDDGYIWFEQYGGGVAASLVVPGHLAALLGVYDYWRATHDPIAKSLFVGGTSTMLHWLPKIRSRNHPFWYAVGNRSSDSRFDGVVTRQLRQLAGITGDERLARYADRAIGGPS